MSENSRKDTSPAQGTRDLVSITPGSYSALRINGAAVREVLPELIDALTDAVIVVDSNHQVVAANQRYMEAFGARREELVGEHCNDVLMCPDLEGVPEGEQCAACVTLQSREPVKRIRAVPDPDGRPRRWEATFNPVLDDNGEVTHIVEVWRDISERSQLEAQLSHSERLASLGGLAAGVAHEINNPLASVLASVESVQRLIKRTPGIPEPAAKEVKEVMDACEREIARVHETTEKLMLLAQPVAIEPAWVDVNGAVSDTVSLLRYQMRKQQVECDQELDPHLPLIWCREGGVRSICMNLMMNAVQAMADGGNLMVKTQARDNAVVIEVVDDGPGIPPDIFERIWDPFFSTKPVGKGTGLGLSITRTLVERYGGQIAVRSHVGEGATFIVELPVKGGPNG